MKAKELRLGNYVNIGLRNSDLRTDYDILTASGLLDLSCNGYKSSFIYKPIPLTEEWLIKLGYTKNRTYFNIAGHKVWMCNDIFLCDKNGVVLKYVHQLQNLYFALTNEELTIKE